MRTAWALLFFDAMFRDPDSFGRKINHLAVLWQLGWLRPQIVLTVLATDDWMNEHLIRLLYLPQMMARVAFLPSGFFPARLPQALDGASKAV